MYAVFTLDIYDAEHEFSYDHWVGDGKTSENLLREEIKEFLKNFCKDAQIVNELYHSEDDLNARYGIDGFSYQIYNLMFVNTKKDVIEWVLSRTKI